MDERLSRGVVKFWRAEKGWRAISSPDLPPGRDAFAHFSTVEMPGYRVLDAGQEVEFSWSPATQDSFDFLAVRVLPLPPSGADPEVA